MTDCEQKLKLIILAFFTGFVGDMLLQLGVNYKIGDWGLKRYFEQHGVYESLHIAGAMLALFYMLYLYTGLKVSYLNITIYAILLDLAFRKFRIFPSLDGYYKHLNYFWSAFWAIVPMLIPLILTNYV